MHGKKLLNTRKVAEEYWIKYGLIEEKVDQVIINVGFDDSCGNESTDTVDDTERAISDDVSTIDTAEGEGSTLTGITPLPH